MKKFLAVFMTLVMAAVLLVGCASGDKEPTDNDKQTPAPAGNVKLPWLAQPPQRSGLHSEGTCLQLQLCFASLF